LPVVLVLARGDPPGGSPRTSDSAGAPESPLTAPVPEALPVAPTVPAPALPSSAPAPTTEGQPTPSAAGATLVFTSDLPARVTLDGMAIGTTPIRGRKTPSGTHAIGFTSMSLGERLTTSVVVQAGDTRSVHAEFTRPVPRLRVR
jgi:hypothetical protein